MKKLISLGLIRPTRTQLAVAAGLLVVVSLLLFRLGTSPTHLSVGELATLQGANLHALLHNPLDAPYRLVEWTLVRGFGPGVYSARLASVVFAIIAVMLFFINVLRWHGWRTAWLAGILFATSGWLLHAGRLATTNILWFLLPLIFIPFSLWLEHTKRHALALVSAAIIFGLALFVPAAIWFEIVCVVVAWQSLAEHFEEAKALPRTVATCICLLFIVAIAFAMYRSPDLLRSWLGLPHTLPSIKVIGKTWTESVTLFPFARGPANAELWLGHTPILDAFTAVLTLTGAWFYARHLGNARTRLMLGFIIIGSILTGLNGAAGMNFLIPIAYLLAATGLTYALHKWLRVFPRNPLARGAGIFVITLAVFVAATYHLTAYFIAWPHNPNTTSTFRYNP